MNIPNKFVRCERIKKAKSSHFIDSDKYSKVSKSKTLCGISGKHIWVIDAVFYAYPKNFCKKCLKHIKENI